MKTHYKMIGIVALVLLLFRLLSPARETPAPPVQNIYKQHNITLPAAAPLKAAESYHIAYLLARSAEFEDEIERPENLFKGFEGHRLSIVYTWADLLALHARQPLDSLVLHSSAVRMVDFEWTAHAYWRGITMSTVGIYPAMIGHLYDHACLTLGYGMPFYGEGTYFTVSTSTLLNLQDRDQAARWYRRDWRRDCYYPRPAEITDPYGWALHYTSGPLSIEVGSDWFKEFLINHILYDRAFREEFEKEHKR